MEKKLNNHLQFKMWGNQLSDNYNTTTKIVNERKKTKFVKRSEQRDYLNRIEMKKNEPMNMFIENKGCQSVFFCKRTNNIEEKHKTYCIENKQTSDLSGNFIILWLVYFDLKFTACFCMIWPLLSVIRNSLLFSLSKFF